MEADGCGGEEEVGGEEGGRGREGGGGGGGRAQCVDLHCWGGEVERRGRGFFEGFLLGPGQAETEGKGEGGKRES